MFLSFTSIFSGFAFFCVVVSVAVLLLGIVGAARAERRAEQLRDGDNL